MGSHSTQAAGISAFLISFAALGGAFAGGGVLMYLAFVVLFGIAVAILLKCKAMEKAAD